jgi:hypothetical protein
MSAAEKSPTRVANAATSSVRVFAWVRAIADRGQ